MMAIYHVVIKIPFNSDFGAHIVTDDSGHWLVYTQLDKALAERDRWASYGDRYIYQVMELEL